MTLLAFDYLSVTQFGKVPDIVDGQPSKIQAKKYSVADTRAVLFSRSTVATMQFCYRSSK